MPTSGQCTGTSSASSILRNTYNVSTSSLADVGYMYNKRYTYDYKSAESSYLYGNSFTYSGGTYTLTNTQSVELNYFTVSDLNDKHYTCFNATGSCATLSYVFNYYRNEVYYINLTGGTSIEKALNEMLYDDNVNTTNSVIKATIDAWYADNMTGYTSYLEDTIWCNDRSRNYPIQDGWNPNGGDMTFSLYFKSYGNTNNLTCQNRNDRFTVSSTNGNGKLTYPVGLVTRQEQTLAYYSNNSPIQNGNPFWTLSPGIQFGYMSIIIVDSNGNCGDVDGKRVFDIRPAVSLKTGIEYKSGDGTSENPFVVKT